MADADRVVAAKLSRFFCKATLYKIISSTDELFALALKHGVDVFRNHDSFFVVIRQESTPDAIQI